VATAGIGLEKPTAAPSVAWNYQVWQRVIAVLDQKRIAAQRRAARADPVPEPFVRGEEERLVLAVEEFGEIDKPPAVTPKLFRL